MTHSAPAPQNHQAEERRIRAAYAARPANDPRYSAHNPAHVYLADGQRQAVLTAIRQAGWSSMAGLSVLDVGCGRGNWLRQFIEWGVSPSSLAGIDLLEDRIADARRNCPPGVELHQVSGASMPFETGRFDVVTQFTVFTSILDAGMRQGVAAEMMRVVRSGGIILWYDFHTANPRNPDVRPVAAGEIRSLFPGCGVSLTRVSLAPPIVRALMPGSAWLCRVLDKIPLLRTHYLGVIRRP